MLSTTPRRSERIAAKAAAETPIKLRRSKRLAEKAEKAATTKKAENIESALQSYYRIKAACDAVMTLVEMRDMPELESIEEPSRMSAAAEARAAADAVLQDEKEERQKARDDVDEAWESYFIARHYALLSIMRGQPEEEQRNLKMLCDAAVLHLQKCIDYADTICLGFEDDDE